MPCADCFIFSESEGLVEPLVDLGQPVRDGDLLPRICPPTGSARRRTIISACMDGILAARHFPGLFGSATALPCRRCWSEALRGGGISPPLVRADAHPPVAVCLVDRI